MLLISYHARGIERLTKRDINDSLRDMAAAIGLRHRRRNLATHFTKRAYSLYGYKPREGDPGSRKRFGPGAYQYRKLRKFSHTLPLVWTGELRRQTLYGLRTVKATATKGEATVRVILPPKANFVLRDLTAVADVELMDLERFAGEELERQFAKRGAEASSVGVNIFDSTRSGPPAASDAA